PRVGAVPQDTLPRGPLARDSAAAWRSAGPLSIRTRSLFESLLTRLRSRSSTATVMTLSARRARTGPDVEQSCLRAAAFRLVEPTSRTPSVNHTMSLQGGGLPAKRLA